jgi:O-antigen ligase
VRNNFFIIFCAYAIISLFGIVAVIDQFDSKSFVAAEINLLTIVSLAYFLLLCFAGAVAKRFYFFIFPFVILTVPNAINDLFPSFFLGPMGERGASTFAFFTHLDVFLLLGVLRLGRGRQATHRASSAILAILALVLFTVQAIYQYQGKLVGPYFIGLYQIRYLLLLLMLVPMFDTQRGFRKLYLGVCFATPLLLFESIVTTFYGGGATNLASGNFAVNGYANLLAAISLFLSFSRRYALGPTKGTLVISGYIALLVCAIVLTGTRAAAVSVVAGYILLHLICSPSSRRHLYNFLLLCSFILFFLAWLAPVISGDVQANYTTAVNGLDGSSLQTRIALWTMTIEMISDHPFFGIGNGLWNYLKYDYGTPYAVLLDPHNDYLAHVVNYGLLGFAVIFFFYIHPLSTAIAQIFLWQQVELKRHVPPIAYLSFIIPISISSFSNANTTKHQVFAFFVFFVLCYYKTLTHTNAIKRWGREG